MLDETIWLTQKQMGDLFQKDVRTISEHIRNVYLEGELEEDSAVRKFRIVRQEGNRQVNKNIDHSISTSSIDYDTKTAQALTLAAGNE